MDENDFEIIGQNMLLTRITNNPGWYLYLSGFESK